MSGREPTKVFPWHRDAVVRPAAQEIAIGGCWHGGKKPDLPAPFVINAREGSASETSLAQVARENFSSRRFV